MKIVAAVFADFEQTFFGTPSQLMTRLGSKTIIEHTLTRTAQIEGVDAFALVVKPSEEAIATQIIAQCGLTDRFDVLPVDDVPRPRLELFRTGRVWNRYAWRSGVVGMTWFDEYIEPLAVGKVINHYNYEGVLCLSGYQPALDIDIATKMVAQQRERENEATNTFTQSPPGIAGTILTHVVIQSYLDEKINVGIPFPYRPEMPAGDPINRPPCYQVPSVIVETPARFTGDTRRSREILEAAWSAIGEDASAVDLCRWLQKSGLTWSGPLPTEIEIELTTDDPLPENKLRPRGSRVPKRKLADIDRLDKLTAELAEYDDRLVVLAGHGDPLRHTQFGDICRLIRKNGVSGLGVVTPLCDLTDVAIDTLFETPVDLIEVQLDATTAETYRTVHGRDAFDQVTANIDKLVQERIRRRRPRPIVTCSLTRCAQTLDELEEFYDHWIKSTNWAVINGYNTYCDVLPPDSLLHLAPPIRQECRRLSRRLILLADGKVPFCSQDVAGTTSLGDWHTDSLSAIWSSDALNNLRDAHSRLDLSQYPLCEKCGEWFRP